MSEFQNYINSKIANHPERHSRTQLPLDSFYVSSSMAFKKLNAKLSLLIEERLTTNRQPAFTSACYQVISICNFAEDNHHNDPLKRNEITL